MIHKYSYTQKQQNQNNLLCEVKLTIINFEKIKHLILQNNRYFRKKGS